MRRRGGLEVELVVYERPELVGRHAFDLFLVDVAISVESKEEEKKQGTDSEQQVGFIRPDRRVDRAHQNEPSIPLPPLQRGASALIPNRGKQRDGKRTEADPPTAPPFCERLPTNARSSCTSLNISKVSRSTCARSFASPPIRRQSVFSSPAGSHPASFVSSRERKES